MDVSNTSPVNYNSSSDVRSVFVCPQLPDFIWELNDTTFPWILTVLTFIASPVTVLLNTLAIIAMKSRRELQKLANILLCSMAVTDLLTGAITMPLSATVDVLILRQSSFEHICTLDAVNKPMTTFLSITSLYHLTAIAWERYMAIQKWIDYRNKVTKSLLKKLGITAWLLEVFALVLVSIMVVSVGHISIRIWVIGRIAVIVGCLIAIAYFYIMVFLGVRKREQTPISQVTVLMKAKLESKVAKTTALLTTAIICSFIPLFVFVRVLRNFFPVFRLNSSFRLGQTLVQFNSLVSPILYCFRDRRFRNAVQELLGMRKSSQVQQQVDAARFSRRKDSSGSVELAIHNVKKLPPQRTRSASTEPAVEIGETPKTFLKRSISYPTLNIYGNNSFASNFKPQQPSFIIITSAVIHSESSNRRKPRDNKGEIHPAVPIANDSPKRSATPTRTSLTRSKSWENRACVEVCNSCQTAQVRTITRQNSAP